MPDRTVRLERLRHALGALDLDALIVTQPQNRRYLSGFTGSDGTLFITQDLALLITDFRYVEQSALEAPDFQVVETIPEALPDRLQEVAGESRSSRVGFESHHVSFDDYSAWAEKTQGFELVPTTDLVEEMRALKDEEELETIKRAVALADAAMAHLREFIQPGMVEKEAAWELESYMRTHGAEGVAFDLIVAGGPNGAMPHATASDHVLQAGQPIVVDIGARVDGYHSDLTRTLYLGEPDDRFSEIYDLVLEAQLAAEEGIRPGMACRQADALARDVIARAGYGKYFGHGLGHGVGLAVHEKPLLRSVSDYVLRAGMVVTIEPGIYIAGWGGVRIEDLVALAEDGAAVLSGAQKKPVVAPD
jgi:Xaa-Pro aminopeptidase